MDCYRLLPHGYAVLMYNQRSFFSMKSIQLYRTISEYFTVWVHSFFPLCLLPFQPLRFPAYTLFQLVAVGSASFFAAALLSALAYSYCHHLNRPSAESAVIHPSTPNHLTYNKQGNTAPKNEKYIPMEFKVRWFNTL